MSDNNNTSTNRDLVFIYCFDHNLDFCSHGTLVAYWGGAEKWNGVQCAGVDHMGIPFIIQEDDGRVKVVSASVAGMVNKWRYVTEQELRSTKQLHGF
jgi:L-asparaginase II